MMQRSERQRGATLIVVLVLVLLVSLAGIAAIRSLVIEERMASNSLDRSLAMQSLERTLRYAESVAQAQSVAPTFNSDFRAYTGNTATSSLPNGTYTATTCGTAGADLSPCNAGLCSQPTFACKPRWDAGGTWGTVAIADLPSGTNRNFEYLIEFLGSDYACNASDPDDKKNCSQYRLTVRSPAGTDRAFAQLQSYYLALPK
jgi:type IV pilus assembly protein PilX